MSKFKTKKTLLKRIKKTPKGKLLRKYITTGHLKSKWSTNRKFRKKNHTEQSNSGHIKKLKEMLGKNA